MMSLIKNRDLYTVSLSCLLFVLVVFQKLISPAIGLFIIVFLYELLIRKSLKFNFSIELVYWVILFLIYVLSLFKASQVDVGLKLLEYKMSFFIFPIIFSFKRENFAFWTVIQGFLLGVLVLMVSLSLIYLIGGESYAYASAYYFNIHPSYSSAYITVALFVFFYGIYLKVLKVHPFLFLIFLLFTVFTLFALISFAALLFFLISLAIVALIVVYSRFSFVTAVATLLVGSALVFFTVTKSERLSYDYRITKQTLGQIFRTPETFIEDNKNATSGTEVRVLVWLFALEVIQDNPFGVGLGDIDLYLDEKVNKYEINYLAKKHLNPHNQFLQICIDTGLLGLAFLIFMFMAFIRTALKTKNYLLLFIVFNLIFNCLFESMLQRQSGIIFYTLLVTVFITYASKIQIQDQYLKH